MHITTMLTTAPSPQPTGILLINVGSPKTPQTKDVQAYLHEFLMDKRVMDFSTLWRWLLVHLFIVPSRVRQSAKSYEAIWTAEGSPLLLHGQKDASLLQEALGKEYIVTFACRYQQPAIEEKLEELRNLNVGKIVVFPLFPQYASATTGSAFEAVMRHVKTWPFIPELLLINGFATHPLWIDALAAEGSAFLPSAYDHILFSFHGLPESHVKKHDRAGVCLKEANCCKNQNKRCYRRECLATFEALKTKLQLEEGRCSMAFQSRLGKDPWLKPYTQERLHTLAREGKKRVLLFSPSFVSDCLETSWEIGTEYKAEFLHQGGTKYDLVPGLNSSELWIKALHKIILERLHHA